MSRLIQIARNTFIRIEGLIYQLFGFIGQLFGWVLKQLNFLGKLLGFAESQYLQEDEAPRSQSAKTELDVTAPDSQETSPVASSSRRRPDNSMDYFLKLAQQGKTSKK